MPLRLRVYVALVIAAGGLLLLASSPALSPGQLANPLLALLILMGALALNFPVTVSPGNKLHLAGAVYFAAVLLFPAPLAMAVAGLSQVVGESTQALRQACFTPRKPSIRRVAAGVLFNAAQFMIATWVAGAVYATVNPAAGADGLSIDRVENLWAIPASAVSLYLVNHIFMSVGVALMSQRSPFDVFLQTQRVAGIQMAGLFLVGLVMALTAVHYPWAMLVMVLPAAIILISLKRTLQLAEQTIAAVEAMADVVDMRDHYTYEHSRRVADYAVEIARRLRLPYDEVQVVRLAARVHDLGKIGIPDGVLQKPGKLTAEEFEQVKKHPELSHFILSRFSEYGQGMELVLTHHERFDGQGYPSGRVGRELPLGCQVIPVADALDAMTSARPHRPALTFDQALAELRRGSGTQWNPDVVDAAHELLTQQAILVPRAVPV